MFNQEGPVSLEFDYFHSELKTQEYAIPAQIWLFKFLTLRGRVNSILRSFDLNDQSAQLSDPIRYASPQKYSSEWSFLRITVVCCFTAFCATFGSDYDSINQEIQIDE